MSSTPERPPLHDEQYPGDPPVEQPTAPLSSRDRVLIEGPLAPETSSLPSDPEALPSAGRLTVATCQFAVSRHLRRNARRVVEQIGIAGAAGARVAHFPEAALGGYRGRDRESWVGFDWGLLGELTQRVCAAAREQGLWVLLGSAHRLEGSRRPHNSVYVIDDHGELVDRYDKRFCTTNDLSHYTPGDHRVTFEVDGVRCGVAICFDVRFPELYREYKAVGVDCVFQCNYDARGKGRTHFRHIMRQTMQTRCATNHLWMSVTNSSAHYQSYASIFVRPDGRISARLRDHRPGVMINLVDLEEEIYDATAGHRLAALQGRVHNGEPFFDRRSLDRQRW